MLLLLLLLVGVVVVLDFMLLVFLLWVGWVGVAPGVEEELSSEEGVEAIGEAREREEEEEEEEVLGAMMLPCECSPLFP
jgi:hypothetical protein